LKKILIFFLQIKKKQKSTRFNYPKKYDLKFFLSFSKYFIGKQIDNFEGLLIDFFNPIVN